MTPLRDRGRLAFGVLSALAGGALLVRTARRGWLPRDEGLLGQSAERVLRGELPHRDFDAVYTGGLELLHAAAFRVLGVELSSLRWVLLAFALAFVVAVYLLALRFARPPLAAALTVAAVAWSVPNYFASLPSWYVLFFWTFGGVFLARWADARTLRWLVATGACAGFAFLSKSPGILLLAVAFLFLVFDDQLDAREEPGSAAARPLLWALAGAIAVLLLAILAVIRRHLGGMELLLYVAPSAALGALLLWREARLGDPWPRARRVVTRCLALGAGAALAVVPFLVPYALSGGLGDFWHGTFVLPQERADHVTFPLPPEWTLVAVLPLALPLAFPSSFARVPRPILAGAAALLGAALLALGGREPVYRAIWYSVRPMAPLAVVLGALTLARLGRSDGARARDGFLVLALASLIGILQYPFAVGIYFCYTAPLVVLAVAWTARERARGPLAWAFVPTLAFFAAFGLAWLNTGWVRTMGAEYRPHPPTMPLELARAGIEVPQPEALLYRHLVDEIERHAAPGEFIYAAPDCPEVYFLSGRRNPTRTFYDVFDEDHAAPEARDARILRTLEERGVRLVVVSTEPEFSEPLGPELVSALSRRYPATRRIGPFLVAWRP